MRRHVRALRHEAHVAQITVIYDFPVDLLVDPIDLARGGRVDGIKQCRKGVAQAEATTAAVADVEDALELFLECGLVVEIGITPVERMSGGGLETAFPSGGGAHACY